uniref:NADH-ubiquinone oxidoreductase chain 4L n=1 Tax=Histeridae sp. BMNH 1274743 TaxID=1796510 RepID=A0A140EG61_9COLE|nr:NADH dehydrogenase subunit 4L [Histeridae sp. BMNH 1274743]
MMGVSFMFFMSGIISFSLKRKHLLLMLLSLEMVVISLYMGLMFYLCMFGFEFYFSMIFLTMSVCEGSLGLSILVSLIRTHGSDVFSSFNLVW